MTVKLAVFGNPIEHSLSPQIHRLFGESAGIDLSYEKQLVPLDGFADAAQAFFAGGGTGINITVPFKKDAFEFVSRWSEVARLAGAVNTIVKDTDGKLRGENTDGSGLVSDLQNNLGWQLKGKSILILGAGGAVQGVLPNLLDTEPQQIVIANRTHANAVKLADATADERVIACPLDDLSGPFDVIISASSAGLGDASTKLDLPVSLLGPNTCVYDMIYGKETPFLRWSESLPSSQCSDGLGMLVEQAACAFNLWFGVKVETRSVLDQLRTDKQKV